MKESKEIAYQGRPKVESKYQTTEEKLKSTPAQEGDESARQPG